MALKWLSTQVYRFSQILGFPNTGGVLAATIQARATEVRGILKVYKFDFLQAGGLPMIGGTSAAMATGDTVAIAMMKPTDWIYGGKVFTNDWEGTAVTIDIGKIDPNNSTNTDLDHYAAAIDVTGAAAITDLTLNVPEQVGDDPKGDQSTGNKVPEFGSADIIITATLGGTLDVVPVGTCAGYLLIVEEGN